jgi:hypothetical protein
LKRNPATSCEEFAAGKREWQSVEVDARAALNGSPLVPCASEFEMPTMALASRLGSLRKFGRRIFRRMAIYRRSAGSVARNVIGAEPLVAC